MSLFYLQGIETRLPHANIFARFPSLFYLQGIETLLGLLLRTCQICLYSTYKELKLMKAKGI